MSISLPPKLRADSGRPSPRGPAPGTGSARPNRRLLAAALSVAVLLASALAVTWPRLTATPARSAPARQGEAPATRTTLARADAVAEAKPAPVVHYSFDDEFGGPQGAGPNYGLARRFWLSDPCWSNGCGTPPDPTRYSLANATLDGKGHLVLTAENGATGSCGAVACRYTSARLTMLDWSHPSNGAATWSQQYGTFSARIKVPVATDVFPAFFLVGSNLSAAGWPPAGEIDVFDGIGSTAVGEQQAEFGTSSYVVPFGGAFVLPKGESFSGWHVYGVSWSPTGIVWSVDGRRTLAMPASRAGPNWASCFEHPFSMVLELEVGPAMTPAVAARVLPARMLVDWVRVRAGS